MEDRIEKRIAIRSTQDKVWGLITRPGWWLPGSDAQPARGPGRMSVTCGGAWPYVIDVLRVEPKGYVSFRWASAFGGAAPAPGNATTIELYVRTAGDEVGVTVVESGFAALDLPEALREDEWTGNAGGWQYELAGLRTRAEQDRLCSPIRAGCSPRSPIPAAVSCLSCSRARPASVPARSPRGCRFPARRSPSTWPGLRSHAWSAASAPDAGYCSA